MNKNFLNSSAIAKTNSFCFLGKIVWRRTFYGTVLMYCFASFPIISLYVQYNSLSPIRQVSQICQPRPQDI